MEPSMDLPAGWVIRESKSHPGTVYFFNEFSRASRWEKPVDDPSDRPSRVRASHILVKHQGSRNPVSRRTGEKVSRTAEEAIELLKTFQKQVKEDPTKFAEIAEKNSDCSSFKRGGDLGPFGRNQMQKPFEDCTYNLAIKEISGIIETDSGFHIVLRTK
mmetsp:Transcript_9772/g.16008  ORF Transcript_9772/g.16008 Transcript_9772/m.16008 type:complete len:159 (+) Transcript_9772:193-669(+)